MGAGPQPRERWGAGFGATASAPVCRAGCSACGPGGGPGRRHSWGRCRAQLRIVAEWQLAVTGAASLVEALTTARESLLQAALLEGATLPARERQLTADMAAGRRGTFREAYVAAIRALDAAALDRAARLLLPASMRTTPAGDLAVLAPLGRGAGGGRSTPAVAHRPAPARA